jgi:hypothetical protein
MDDDNFNKALNLNYQADLFSAAEPFQQHYACQECIFFSNDSQAILAHLNNSFHLNARISSAALRSPFQRAKHPFRSPTFDIFKDDGRSIVPSVQTNEMASQAPFQSDITTSIESDNVNKDRKFVNASDSIICLDIGYQENQNINQSEDTQHRVSFFNGEIEPLDAEDAKAVSVSLEGDEGQSRHEVEYQQTPHPRLQNKTKRRTIVSNKIFKCAKCHFRSNRPNRVSEHFTLAHRQDAFDRTQCIQELDEDEDTRILAAYERNNASKNLVFKPYKCTLCEFRTRQKANAYVHIRKIHKLDSQEAMRLVEVMPFDEAKKTVGEYNKKFACYTSRLF